MSHTKTDAELIKNKHNTARFFVNTRQVSWVLLILTCLWGVYGYFTMPQRKDPDIQVRTAVALVPWPGSSAEKVEQLVTKKVEEQMAANSKVTKIESISRTGLAVIYVELDENLKETGKEFDDIKLRLDGIRDLPSGAGPINFIKDFGDTAALMLTVASPEVSEVEIGLRARDLRRAIEEARAAAVRSPARTTLAYLYPRSLDTQVPVRAFGLFVDWMTARGLMSDVRVLNGTGFIAADAVTVLRDDALLASIDRFLSERLHASELHPDGWKPVIVRNPAGTTAALRAAAGARYTYRELDDFTDLIARTLQTVPPVSKIDRSGVLNERVFLEYSQGRLAAYGVRTNRLPNILGARNITATGGVLEAGGKNITIDPSGEFRSEKEIGDVLVTASSTGSPLYLRDLATVIRSYDSPPRFLNFFTSQAKDGSWQRRRAITLGVQMRQGEQIAKFGKAV